MCAPTPLRSVAPSGGRHLRTPLALLLTVAALAACAPIGEAQVPTEVKVERVQPRREKHATLRFLKENRDFIRARFDRLRDRPVDRRADADAIDPRFLAYREMLARILSAEDSTAAAENRRAGRELFASVTELGEVEAQLDLLERLLAEQRARLGVLQSDFTGDQQTALMVVVSGYPADAAVSTIALRLEDGGTISVELTDDQRESLRRGGAVEVFHGFIEPREQFVEVSLGGGSWPAGDSGFVTLDPARDRLTLLRLDLSTLRPDRGAPSIRAGTWIHDARVSDGDG